MTEIKQENQETGESKSPAEEPPPILKSWKNIYLLVLGNLLLLIILFYIFTWTFK